MNKAIFQTMLGLTNAQPWIADKIDELTHLIFDECVDLEKQELILGLLERFTYLSEKDFNQHLLDLAWAIATDPCLDQKDTLITAMAADAYSDSSQYIVYCLKPKLEDIKWRDHKSVTTFGKAYQVYKSSPAHKNIVLVDEFIGTGNTALGRVREIKKIFSDKGIVDYTVRIYAIAASKTGIRAIQDEGIKIHAHIELDKGISDFYPQNDVTDKTRLMLELENILSDSFSGRKLPSLGYGEVECLYSRMNGNTPNSVFPIFWWKFLADNTERPTLLTRAMADA